MFYIPTRYKENWRTLLIPRPITHPPISKLALRSRFLNLRWTPEWECKNLVKKEINETSAQREFDAVGGMGLVGRGIKSVLQFFYTFWVIGFFYQWKWLSKNVIISVITSRLSKNISCNFYQWFYIFKKISVISYQWDQILQYFISDPKISYYFPKFY